MPYLLNGLQVNGGGMFDREFTKSLIIRDFDDVLKNNNNNNNNIQIYKAHLH